MHRFCYPGSLGGLENAALPSKSGHFSFTRSLLLGKTSFAPCVNEALPSKSGHFSFPRSLLLGKTIYFRQRDWPYLEKVVTFPASGQHFKQKY